MDGVQVSLVLFGGRKGGGDDLCGVIVVRGVSLRRDSRKQISDVELTWRSAGRFALSFGVCGWGHEFSFALSRSRFFRLIMSWALSFARDYTLILSPFLVWARCQWFSLLGFLDSRRKCPR